MSDELKDLIAGAHLPWAHYGSERIIYSAELKPDKFASYSVAGATGRNHVSDAKLIVAAVNAVPELLELRETLKETEASEMRYRSALRQILIEYNEHDAAGIDVIASIARDALEGGKP